MPDMEMTPSIAPTCRQNQAPLDGAMWGAMPESVLYLVLSKLPLKSLARMRALSKLWHSAPFFSTPIAPIAPIAPASARFALLHRGPRAHEAWVFDTPNLEWCKFPLAPFPSARPFCGPFASAGGLLCYISDASPKRSLEVAVGNPVTASWRLLPPPRALHSLPSLAHMAMAPDHRSYSLALVGMPCDPSGALVVEVYDSGSNSWRAPSPTSTLHYRLFQGGEYQGPAAMDARSERIERVVAPRELREIGCLDCCEEDEEGACGVVESAGTLWMCSRVRGREGLWRRRAEGEWERVCAMPTALQGFDKTALHVWDDVVLIMGSEPRCFAPQFEDVLPFQMVLLHGPTCEWRVLPAVGLSFGRVEDVVGGFMFEPRFDTNP